MESHAELRSFVELIPSPLAVVRDGDWRVLCANGAMRRLVGGSTVEAPLPDSFADWVERARLEVLARAVAAGATVCSEPLRVRGAGGAWLECLAAVSRVVWDGAPALLWGLTDMSAYYRLEREVGEAQVRATELMTRLSFQDSLTGLSNRALLFDRISHTLKRCRRSGEAFALLFLDLDGFKGVNDSHGHEAGDRVLRAVAERLSRAVRGNDTVARLGGDEFATLLEGVGAPDEVTSIAEKLIALVNQPVSWFGGSVSVGVSIGAAMYPADGASSDVLLAQADAAMYASKQRGKNVLTFASDRRAPRPVGELLPWSEGLVVGVGVVDHQHRLLTDHVNRLFAAVSAGEEALLLRGLLGELTEYAALHFTTEESLMDRVVVDDAAGHKDDHTKMIADLRTLHENFERYGLHRTLETASAFLAKHIVTWDRELGRQLRAKGIR